MDWLVIEKEIAKQIKESKTIKSKDLRLHIINHIYVNYHLPKTFTNHWLLNKKITTFMIYRKDLQTEYHNKFYL